MAYATCSGIRDSGLGPADVVVDSVLITEGRLVQGTRIVLLSGQEYRNTVSLWRVGMPRAGLPRWSLAALGSAGRGGARQAPPQRFARWSPRLPGQGLEKNGHPAAAARGVKLSTDPEMEAKIVKRPLSSDHGSWRPQALQQLILARRVTAGDGRCGRRCQIEHTRSS
jgi:hypothetical protein